MKAVGYLLFAIGILHFIGASITNQMFGQNTSNDVSKFTAKLIISCLLIFGGFTLIRKSKPKI
jgi:hypothetical protein